ncbi:MAG TPA: MSMEG_0567/Sll0786 family nitrogen starvation N-acetyltransferase [Polyangia bacterium]|nr:MSMEG_0567/Sll0786 family nitrogen starvation N-acetyltransferase [Polyangia bacterium]
MSGEAALDPTAIATRLARGGQERDGYFALRRAIFCEEQGLFAGDDRDEHDDGAYPIVCVDEAHDRVVGVVRIWETEPGLWWGGRLGVVADCRAAAVVGRRLVQTAVGTARAWGATRFLATVQRANVPFFRRLRWRTVETITLLGQPHDLMEADLAHYAPTAEVRPARAPERHAA